MLTSLLAVQIDPFVGIVMLFTAVLFIVFLFVEEVFKQRRKRTWEAFAKELQSKHTTDIPKSPIGEIKLRIQSTPVTIDGCSHLSPLSFTLCTRVSTPVSMPEDFRLVLSPERAVDSLSRAFGGQDIALGDPLFDQRFVVRSTDELLCHLWLNAMIRPMLLLSETYTFAVQDDTAMMTRIGYETDFAPLKQAAEIVAKLGKHSAKLSENWQSLAKHFNGKIKNANTSSPLPHNTYIELDHQGRRYVLSVILTRYAGVLTRLIAQHPSQMGPFSISPKEHPVEASGDPVSVEGLPTKYQVFANIDAGRLVPQQALPLIQKITPYAIVGTAQSVELLLSGFVYTIETIQIALELSNLFVSSPEGPYR